MTLHINLYDPALRRQRQWLTATNLLFALALIFVVLFGWGAWARIHAGWLSTDAVELDARTKAARAESIALASRLASSKPDPKLELDIASARELLGVRRNILDVLGKDGTPRASGYAEYLRGLARQTISGLWLTGFAVSADGSRMEIRGRMLDPARLPVYIRGLSNEPAFHGNSFAALSVAAPEPAARETERPPWLEFALVPELETSRTGGGR
ncbi:MAG: PilN domain-containing protein [Gammaproteobacteria bacterium]|nr:PilN domain-containing protein [Gammaproteobacteria bacterium]MBU1416506.1 PilN domain-containing protein [Gammaproteobacteria bacterium]